MNQTILKIYSEKELDKIHKPYGVYRGILQICEDILGYIRGSSEGAFYGYNDVDLFKEVEYLKNRIQFWEKTEDFFDLTVKNLIEATILRVEIYKNGKRI